MTNIDRDVTLPTKVRIVKAMVFPVVMYRCERWTIKKCWRIDPFELWCWRRFLRVPWTARRSNQSILEEINPEYSLEGLKLKLWYFGHLRQRANSLEKTPLLGRLKAGGEGDDREWDGWMASPTQWTWVWANSGRWWRTSKPGITKSQTQLSDWTATTTSLSLILPLPSSEQSQLSLLYAPCLLLEPFPQPSVLTWAFAIG